jgi:sec-independent protein translocase protein TatA
MLNFAIGIGPVEIIIVLAILLLLFGAKRLPELGRSLGTGMREFKSSVTGKDRDDDEAEQIESSSPATSGADASGGGDAEAREPEPPPTERAGTAGQPRS